MTKFEQPTESDDEAMIRDIIDEARSLLPAIQEDGRLRPLVKSAGLFRLTQTEEGKIQIVGHNDIHREMCQKIADALGIEVGSW